MVSAEYAQEGALPSTVCAGDHNAGTTGDLKGDVVEYRRARRIVRKFEVFHINRKFRVLTSFVGIWGRHFCYSLSINVLFYKL